MPVSPHKPNASPSLLFSFRAAIHGIRLAVHSERNLKIHTVLSAFVCLSGWSVGFNTFEWIVLTLCITLMITTELLNTAIESMCDYIEPTIDKRIRNIKDVSAGACLIVALGSSIVGLMLFLPHWY